MVRDRTFNVNVAVDRIKGRSGKSNDSPVLYILIATSHNLFNSVLIRGKIFKIRRGNNKYNFLHIHLPCFKKVRFRDFCIQVIDIIHICGAIKSANWVSLIAFFDQGDI